MDRLIRNAWRAFWIGLGASTVLIAQSLVPLASASTNPDEVKSPGIERPVVRERGESISRHVRPVRGGQS